MLLGCILQTSPRYTERIRGKLPNGRFRPLAIMLAKLLSFLSLAKGVGSSGSESIKRIIHILEAQDQLQPQKQMALSISNSTTIGSVITPSITTAIPRTGSLRPSLSASQTEPTPNGARPATNFTPETTGLSYSSSAGRITRTSIIGLHSNQSLSSSSASTTVTISNSVTDPKTDGVSALSSSSSGTLAGRSSRRC
ncbi:unnamed protein product [Protopolystoma xenopodis]|uniref:WAPL domain-containing protein n=1 Tax=Protopolystoma xenopodis TaxID=117903 RepID=A0A448WU02_9PLAT|nr:unnamed protein product [Protopolystoma xenopodis]